MIANIAARWNGKSVGGGWVGVGMSRFLFCTISSDTHTMLTTPRRQYMPIAFGLV